MMILIDNSAGADGVLASGSKHIGPPSTTVAFFRGTSLRWGAKKFEKFVDQFFAPFQATLSTFSFFRGKNNWGGGPQLF